MSGEYDERMEGDMDVHTGTAVGWYRCDGKDCPMCGPAPTSQPQGELWELIAQWRLEQVEWLKGEYPATRARGVSLRQCADELEAALNAAPQTSALAVKLTEAKALAYEEGRLHGLSEGMTACDKLLAVKMAEARLVREHLRWALNEALERSRGWIVECPWCHVRRETARYEFKHADDCRYGQALAAAKER